MNTKCGECGSDCNDRDDRDELEKLEREIERLRNDVHSCGDTCTRAGCVNARLRAEIAARRVLAAEVHDMLLRGHPDAVLLPMLAELYGPCPAASVPPNV